jgi:uncharacterized membrane protein YdjX (TVP38/TMEM64 family)
MPRRSLARLFLLAALVVLASLAVYRLGWFDYERLARLAAAIRAGRHASGAAPAFVLVFAAATALGVPGTPPTLAGGAIFGAALGTLLNWLGALLGAAGGYWLARALGARSLRRYLCRNPALRQLSDDERGFTALLRLRLIPVVPLGVLNFAAGLAHMDFGSYMAATAIGLLPGTAVYTYFADALLSRVAGAEHAALWRVAVASGLLILLSFVPALARGREGTNRRRWLHGLHESIAGLRGRAAHR